MLNKSTNMCINKYKQCLIIYLYHILCNRPVLKSNLEKSISITDEYENLLEQASHLRVKNKHELKHIYIVFTWT